MGWRRTVVALGLLAVGVAAGASLFGGTAPSSPPAPTAPPDEGRATAADDARAERRRRAAMARLLDRAVGPQRTIEVAVTRCGELPADGAEVWVVGDRGEVARATADADGVARLRVPEEGVLSAFAAWGDHQSASAAAHAARYEVAVCPGATVEGRVVDSRGRPVAEATVVLGDGLDVAVTDADGEFVLTDLQLVADRVTAQAFGASAAAVVADLRPGEVRTLALVVDRVRRLMGFVVDAGGAPVAYAELVAWDVRGAAVARARSDRSGRFWLDEVPHEAVTLVAVDHSGGVGQLVVAADGPREGLVVSLEPAGRLMVDYVGPAPRGFEVLALGDGRLGEAPAVVATLARAGEVAVVRAPGLYRVRYGEPGAWEVCGEVLVTPGASVTVRCGEVRPAVVVGRVVDAAGAPLEGVQIIVAAEAHGRAFASTSADGTFTVGFEAGRSEPVMVVAVDRARGYLPTRRRNVPVVPGETTDVGALQLDHVDAHRDLGGPGPFGGIGARVEDAPDGILLSAIVRGGPLDAAGVRSGDVVLAIGDQVSGFLPALDAVRLLRGEPGTPVTLRLRDAAGATREVTVERAVIDVDAAGWVN